MSYKTSDDIKNLQKQRIHDEQLSLIEKELENTGIIFDGEKLVRKASEVPEDAETAIDVKDVMLKALDQLDLATARKRIYLAKAAQIILTEMLQVGVTLTVGKKTETYTALEVIELLESGDAKFMQAVMDEISSYAPKVAESL